MEQGTKKWTQFMVEEASNRRFDGLRECPGDAVHSEMIGFLIFCQ